MRLPVWCLVLVACSAASESPTPPAEAPPPPAEDPPRPIPEPGSVERWHLEPLAPELATQLTPDCYVHLSSIHLADPRFEFGADEVRLRVGSVGGLLFFEEASLPYRRDGARVLLDTVGFTLPSSMLVPCGAVPTELSVSPGGDRLLANVAHCRPCSHEAAVDGIASVSWVRDAP